MTAPTQPGPEQLRLLLDAVVNLAADLSLDRVLARIVEVASSLADARYAALGVLGGSDRPLQTFIHHGIGEEEATRIGHLPAGHGLLGLIIDRPEPLRLHDIATHPASYGFPANHPPMHSFLGVPVRTRGRVFGNLYLTEKAGGGDFTAQDEAVVVALAAAAGVVIENARLYEEAARRERWLAATAEITAVLSGSVTGRDALQAVTDRALEVAEADSAFIATVGPDGVMVLDALSGQVEIGSAAVFDAAVVHHVVRTGEPVSLERFDVGGEVGQVPAVVVPLRNASGVEGVLGLTWSGAGTALHHAVDADLPARFAEQAALALQVARARTDQERLAVYEDRDRIGRDLHDLVIQRLFAVGLSLQGASRMTDRPEVADRLENSVDELDATIKDIRRTIFALGSMDTAADLQAEVTRMVDRAAKTLKFRPTLEFDGPVRTLVSDEVAPHLLAVLGEALSNTSRHAEATAVRVTLRAGEDVCLEVSDNGRGMPVGAPESGLRNMRERAGELGGRCEIDSGPDIGTTLRWSIPIAR